MLRRWTTSALLAFANLAQKASNAFAALAAGVCDLDALVAHTRDDWDTDERYGLLEGPNVLSGLMEWEKPLVTFLRPGGTVGIVGCGAGRDLIALARLGFRVEGVDIAPRAVAEARRFLAEVGVPGRVYVGDIVAFTFPGERYDAFIFSWFTYGYIPRAARRIRALQNLRPKLADEGCVIVSFRPYRGRGERMTRLAHWVGRLTRNPHPPELGDVFSRTLSFEHRFTREEITREAAAAGYTVAFYNEGPAAVAVLKPLAAVPSRDGEGGAGISAGAGPAARAGTGRMAGRSTQGGTQP